MYKGLALLSIESWNLGRPRSLLVLERVQSAQIDVQVTQNAMSRTRNRLTRACQQ
jgi:hypothetical protein